MATINGIDNAMDSLGQFIRDYGGNDPLTVYNKWISTGIVFNTAYVPTLLAMARELVNERDILRFLK